MLTPEDLWNKLVEEAGEDPITAAASVSASQAERDLRAAGFDVKAERERANAVIADLTGETAPASDRAEPTAWVTGPASAGRRSPSNRRAVLIAVALAALATVGGILYVLGRGLEPHGIPVAEERTQRTCPPSCTLGGRRGTCRRRVRTSRACRRTGTVERFRPVHGSGRDADGVRIADASASTRTRLRPRPSAHTPGLPYDYGTAQTRSKIRRRSNRAAAGRSA